METSERNRESIFSGGHKNGNIMVRANRKDIDALKAAALKAGCTVSELIRRSVNRYVSCDCPGE